MNSFFETSKKTAKRGRLGTFLRVLRLVFNLALVLAGVGVALAVGLYLLIIREHGEQLHARYPSLVQDSYVYDANGKKIGEFTAEESRETVDFEGLGKPLPQAVIAVEDRRFYDHWGFEPEGLARAAWTDLRYWHVE